ncbi:MAG TPA: hypothetical protein VGZ22_12540 [Isosphaeraceae bacterium]|jgi:hypothetical protein|nr:hypothetical protein [Isosphaeraceae bacterium]
MSKGKAFRPIEWHPLEPRIALSQGSAASAPAAAHLQQTNVSHHHKVHIRLAGTIRGSATTTTVIPDAGQTIKLNGTGWVHPLDQVTGTGVLNEAGFILNGRDQGMLTLSSGTGQITIQFERTVAAGPRSSSGDVFNFNIVGGTGAYQYAIGNGMMTLRTRGSLPSADSTAAPAGSFVLSLNRPLP